jgi:UPF0755 protein
MMNKRLHGNMQPNFLPKTPNLCYTIPMTILAKKILAGVILIVVVIGGGIFLYKKHHENNAGQIQSQQDSTTPAVVDATAPQQTALPQPTETVALTPTPKASTPPPLPPLPVGTDQFTVSLTATGDDQIAGDLLQGGYITDATNFTAILNTHKIPVAPGAYKISKEMTPSDLDRVLHGKPYMVWVVIPPGLRKEEIAGLLASALGWTSKQENTWITVDTATPPEDVEGVYYPDTYLIPVGEDPSLTAKRLIAKFNENFGPYLSQFTAKNIKWARALTLASIVQREAANSADMPLIAGILWNRLDQNMALDVDATLQYARGNTGKGWWAPITTADKKIDSPFNTYMYKGLPPHPISNPGLDAIDAVLNPTQTDCLYYIHDKNHVTHCATTYAEQEANIQEYLIGSTTTPTTATDTTTTTNTQ